MPSVTITWDHSIGDAVVFVEAPDIRGRVQAFGIDTNGQRYRVAWWQDGRRLEEWVYAWEVRAP